MLECLILQCSYINGSPQNTNVPGVVELAKKHGTFIGGDDFKSGQTKMKSVLVDFLVSAGLKVCKSTCLIFSASLDHSFDELSACKFLIIGIRGTGS